LDEIPKLLRYTKGQQASLERQINAGGLSVVFDTVGVEFRCDHEKPGWIDIFAE